MSLLDGRRPGAKASPLANILGPESPYLDELTSSTPATPALPGALLPPAEGPELTSSDRPCCGSISEVLSSAGLMENLPRNHHGPQSSESLFI